MKFVIKHEIKGRIRIHILQSRMTFEQADTLEYYLSNNKLVTSVKVRERLQDATISYIGSREDIIKLLTSFKYNNVEVPDVYLQNSGRELNREYWDKLVNKVFLYGANKIFLPNPIRECITLTKSVKYLWNGVRTLASRKIEVPVLDATAIGVSIARNNMNTAGSIMFLLGIGEILEEWTHKKSVDDLARSMSLNVGKVWLCQGEQDVLVSTSDVREGDLVRVHMGNIIPFDGTVVSGEAMVNQASLTGESIPVQKNAEGIVYAGTVLEEGELVIRVDQTNGSSRYEKIVTMIEESEKLKTSMESKASHLADKLVPYTLLGTGLTYALTRNATKALSVLMVDFSCALKLAMPISVLSAIREASLHNITVKGGKYLEAMAEADTIVFDKTGTLTKANPTVVDVVSFNGQDSDELLRIAACLEEHFPHSMAKAVVDAAAEKNLEHEEVHSEVEYIVAHGISSMIDGQKVVIGSHHFVFEDEKCTVDPEKMDTFNSLPPEYSHLYMAINNRLAAVICIEDPLREEAAAVIQSLKMAGIGKVVMMTGDSDRTAKAIAKKAGIDEYYSEVLPEDKANFVEKEKAKGRKVIMIGDGINDSPALSAADIGVSISDGAEIAREIADVTIGADNLYEIVTLKALSNSLVKRIDKNYRFIVSFNAGLIVLGVAGIIPPTMSALLHNGSTLAIGMKSMENLLD
ncbi:heavy metal translocating P-type ATPase [Eubacterium ventriosum]|jgi:heavy metal translocating P-type ATPase|uniref:Cd(2+)-exporting ATPase n=2 Tax=Eubacterium ventriosum TaxID=39496 RepID=A0A415L3E6_9FIRM|nr:heavy metal translocating P-type ATPase [Eubacterium ventriosum]RHA16967.1 heavy metal translocating P-type ATPase [Eubacterium ventriosum]RHB16709.1 heavy metal translocating P-type ATPase [Eubacterium ventriosum]RHL43068.1 heavy metal translocating P-type ATPase [Eubacterium ventriosum]